MGLNQQLFDMGMLERDAFDVDIVKAYIKNFKKEFNFVMIAEYFEESLILLAHYLCWPLEFMVGVSHNVRKSDKKVSNNEIHGEANYMRCQRPLRSCPGKM